MHLILTDILTCPVCGPQHGLILRADALANRRVLKGALGCPNCRQAFPITNGIAILRGPGAPHKTTAEREDSLPVPVPEAVRIAALLGSGTGYLLITGAGTAVAGEVSELLPDVQIVVALDRTNGEQERAEDEYDINRIVVGESLPFSTGRLNGIWLSGPLAVTHLEDAVRALHPAARLVLEPVPGNAHERLRALGMHIVMHEGHTMLAMRGGS